MTSADATCPEILARHTIRHANNNDCEGVLALVSSVLAEYGLQSDPKKTDADLQDIEANYQRRGGVFEVIEDREQQLVGSMGLYPLDQTACELRKMYLIPKLRGSGVGKYLLRRAIKLARELGFKRMDLETSSKLEAANHLYAQIGFQPTVLLHPSARADQAYTLDL